MAGFRSPNSGFRVPRPRRHSVRTPAVSAWRVSADRRTSVTASSRTPEAAPGPGPPGRPPNSPRSTSTGRPGSVAPPGHRARARHHARRPRPAARHRTAADLDGALQRARRDRRTARALRPGLGRALLPVPLRRPQAAAPGPGALGGPRPGRRRRHLPRPLRPPGHAHDQGAGRHRTPCSRCRSASAPTSNTGASPPAGCASWTGTSRRASAASP